MVLIKVLNLRESGAANHPIIAQAKAVLKMINTISRLVIIGTYLFPMGNTEHVDRCSTFFKFTTTKCSSKPTPGNSLAKIETKKNV